MAKAGSVRMSFAASGNVTVDEKFDFDYLIFKKSRGRQFFVTVKGVTCRNADGNTSTDRELLLLHEGSNIRHNICKSLG
jgi:hypothetical protein